MPSATKGQLTTSEKFAAQLLALGKSLTFAAEQSGVGLPQLRKRLTLPLMQQEVERWRGVHFAGLSESLGARLEELQHPALEAVSDLLTAESEPVRLGAARDLLDRGPLSRKLQGGLQASGSSAIGQISLDQAALTAIISGAMNMGNAAILTAFAALRSDSAAHSETSIASSEITVLSNGPSSPPVNTWHGKP